MSIGLMSNIPNQLIVGCVEHIMQRNGQFDHTEACTKVPPVDGYDIDDILTQFIANLLKLVFTEGAEIGGNLDFIEQGSCVDLVHWHSGMCVKLRKHYQAYGKYNTIQSYLV